MAMLPVASVNNPVPVPIVNTTLPGTVVVHVPYDNVAPSISSAQVNNNASPNSEAAAAEEETATDQADAVSEEAQAASNATSNAAPSLPGPQATFLAQLLSQDGSPPVQTILVQYEKLNALGNVKYKPSNAFRPTQAPANTFGQLLQESRPAPTIQPAAAPTPVTRQPVAAPSAAEQEEAVFSGPTEVSPPPRQPQRNSGVIFLNAAASTPKPTAPQIISAYTQTAARVDIQNTELTTAVA